MRNALECSALIAATLARAVPWPVLRTKPHSGNGAMASVQ